MAVPSPAYTGERFRLGFGEQTLVAALETPVVGSTWIGKVVRGGVTGFGPTILHPQKWFSGDGRLPSERVNLGVDLDGIGVSYEVQDGRFLSQAFGHVTDTGTVQGASPGGSTLATAIAEGDTSLDITNGTNYANGEFIEVDVGGTGEAEPEIRSIVSGALGAGAQTFVVDHAFHRAHLISVACIERIAPFTHTLRVADSYPRPFTLQGTYRAAGTSLETSMAIAGCHIQEFSLAQDVDGLLIANCTVVASRPVDITPPATLPTVVVQESLRFADAAYTTPYMGMTPFVGVKAHSTTMRNGGEMNRHSRDDAVSEFAAEYVPEVAEFEHEITKTARDREAWDELLARADPLTGTILYTSLGTPDTLSVNMTNGVIMSAPADNPEGRFDQVMSFSAGELQLVFVDEIPGY